ncbi:hypothetical protein [Zavarzinia compransoris]|uniref:Uncharacterized protein n=1 Tax=Zavarzinia compransoris TaxID=1264899 RepID=A0A317E871_9PROT|nr:hypothetical protein [Zavarzinia compransoris]PWR23277.1 hypothetical protein DKG75_01520 [Zavarzinia compransoris]TDP46156.1 hypothetical protein DES42_104242 [Zavarzinia compransoris]
MTDLGERKRVYEVHVLRAGRWTVVDVLETREDALAQGERLRGSHEGVRVNIERFDPDRGTFTATTIWEWQAPRRGGPRYQPAPVRPEPFLPRSGQARPTAPKPWWRRWLGL